jgi:hypothetical protein
MRKIVLLGAAMVAALSGCAKRPDAIVPADIPMAAYTGDSCATLARELVTEQEKLATLSKAQHDAANGDAFGVFLIGVPLGSVTGGDKEGEVAVQKGRVVAIQSAMKSKNCE